MTFNYYCLHLIYYDCCQHLSVHPYTLYDPGLSSPTPSSLRFLPTTCFDAHHLMMPPISFLIYSFIHPINIYGAPAKYHISWWQNQVRQGVCPHRAKGRDQTS